MSGDISKGVVIFICGGVLGWALHGYWPSPAPSEIARQRENVPIRGIVVETPPAVTVPSRQHNPTGTERLASLLHEENVDAAIQQYLELARNADETTVQSYRNIIFSRARELSDARRYPAAVRLLTQYVYNEFRDVEARELLSNIYGLQKDYLSELNTLYEARNYAYRTESLERISKRIRASTTAYRSQLTTRKDYQGLLELYQQLTQLEPDYPEHFVGLAEAKLALKDFPGARQSLSLVAYDPSVSSQASLLLARLDEEDPVIQRQEISGIPLQQVGDHFIVTAMLNNAVSIDLLIDTGASLTVIQPASLSAGGVDLSNASRIGRFQTANGPTRGPIVVLDDLAVGDYLVNNLEVGALDTTPLAGADGLLGMNYLKHFEFFIDQVNGVLRLTPRAQKGQ